MKAITWRGVNETAVETVDDPRILNSHDILLEVGSGVPKHRVGDRVVVCSFISCGRCWYCRNELWRPTATTRPSSTTRSSSSCACRRTGRGRARGHLRLPQGRHGVHPRRVRRAGRQVPPGRGDEQVPHPARGQQHGHRYIPRILEGMRTGEIRTEHLATHTLPLEEGPKGYDLFKNKEDGCVRAVFQPNGNGRSTT